MRLSLFIAALAIICIAGSTHADDWPQYLGPQRDGIWREGGIVDTLPKEPKYFWRKEVGQGYSGPAVANGRVFVTDLVLGDGSAIPKSGFTKASIPGKERILCLDEKNGDLLWKKEYDCTYRVSYPGGPRCTPTVDGDFVYTLGAMGNLLCLDVKKGDILWQKDFLKDFDAQLPVWGFASPPLVDGDKLICLVGGSEGRGVIAFDKKTGEVKWKAVTTQGDPGYGVPVIHTVGKNKQRQLIIWHSRAVVGLDPESGKRLWNEPWEIRASLTAVMPRFVEGDKLFLTGFYAGSMLLQLDENKATVIWKSKSKGNQDSVMPDKTVDLHSIMATPFIKGGHIFGVCSYGEMRCLKLDTGERLWETYQPITGKSDRWGHAFIIRHEDRYVLFNEKGELIFCQMTPDKKYEENSRLKILEPTNGMAGRPVVWMHPAFANKNCYARNDKEIVCVSLGK
ncbi:MAG: PQQ-like beta-propeller repeat protein [Planctomycetes bacterium]|nr:PQQ-like beta-propeller repeat protein [Planctomycetota bacterium]